MSSEGTPGDLPPGTGPDVPSAPGTSEDLPPVKGVHTPDAGPGGADLDTAAQPLPGREDPAR
jgi:hypothetical protein